MKTVNKYILASCVICYFVGIYLIAVKIGFMRLISRYGLSKALDKWPENFPSLNIVYVCLAIYTIFFALITYIIYRNIENHGKEMDILQKKTSILHNYSEELSIIVARYNRICREKNSLIKTQSQRLQLLEKQIYSLPTSVLNNSSANSKIARIISDIDEMVSNLETIRENDIEASNIQFCKLIERAIEDVQRLKTNSITLK
ncbi:MAG: hypothetical protein J6Y97_07915 [Prevotella sp.]|nr:hypothetical protein [Prevotella sp.]